MSKIGGFIPASKIEANKKQAKVQKKKPVEDSDAADEDDLRLTEDPLAQDDIMGDAENEFIV